MYGSGTKPEAGSRKREEFKSKSLGRLLKVARIKIAANHENQRRTTYATGTLETVYFKDVTIDLICESVKDPKVAQLLNPKHFLSRPVCMITAVKIAKGLQLQSYRGRESGGHAGIGGLADGANRGQVVFAYQLLKIAPKGWGKGDLQLIEYQSPAASLGSGGDNGEQRTTEDFEASYFGTLDKDGSGGQGPDINVIKTTDDEGNEVNIVSLANTQGHGAGTRRDGEDVRPIQETNNSTQFSRLLKAWKLIN
ncbi:hypothetical protein GGS24DRAFT_513819 [Hypoxylon argillaceum]|nr:hypothetical protein GGS24DRAFT_513819 [Hypoxylon argillaceum]